MAVTPELFDLLEKGRLILKRDYKGLRVLGFGDQRIWVPPVRGLKTEKSYLKSLGVEHTSIDINGKRGALPLDLTGVFPEAEWAGKFDMVTNFGTIEHVNDQYAVFKNAHLFIRKGGVMIHAIPPVGWWRRHCPTITGLDLLMD